MKQTKILAYDPYKKKKVLVGSFNENKGTFLKKVTSKHFFRRSQSYAIQEEVIQQLIELGVTKIIIKSPSSTYTSTLDDWLTPNILVQDFGYGRQRFLPVKYMKRVVE